MMHFSSFISRMALSQSYFSAHARRYLYLMWLLLEREFPLYFYDVMNDITEY